MDPITLAMAKKFALSLALGGATPIPGPPGPSGRQVELWANNTHIVWRYVGDDTWNDLIPIVDLKGGQGDIGPPGTTPHIGENGNWWIGTTDTGVNADGGAADLTEIFEDIAELQGEVAVLKTSDTNLQQLIDDLQYQIDNLEDVDLTDILADIAILQTSLATLEGKFDDAEIDIAELQTKVAELADLIENMEDVDLTDILADIQTLQGDLTTLENDLAAEIANREQAIADKQQQITEINAALAEGLLAINTALTETNRVLSGHVTQRLTPRLLDDTPNAYTAVPKTELSATIPLIPGGSWVSDANGTLGIYAGDYDTDTAAIRTVTTSGGDAINVPVIDMTTIPAPPALPRTEDWAVRLTGNLQGSYDYRRFFYLTFEQAQEDNAANAVAAWVIDGKRVFFEYWENGVLLSEVELTDGAGYVLLDEYQPVKDGTGWFFGPNRGTNAFPDADNIRSIVYFTLETVLSWLGGAWNLPTQSKQYDGAIAEIFNTIKSTSGKVLTTNADAPDELIGTPGDIAITPYGIYRYGLDAITSGFVATINDPRFVGNWVDMGENTRGTNNGQSLGTHWYLHESGNFVLVWSNWSANPSANRAGYWFINYTASPTLDGGAALTGVQTSIIPATPTTLPPAAGWTNSVNFTSWAAYTTSGYAALGWELLYSVFSTPDGELFVRDKDGIDHRIASADEIDKACDDWDTVIEQGIESHNTDPDAHDDIRQELVIHNAAPDAHDDIRTALTNAANLAASLQTLIAASGTIITGTHNATTGDVAFTNEAGQTVMAFNYLQVEFAKLFSFDQNTNVLTLDINGEYATVDLTGLIPVYTGGNTASANTTVSGGVISTTINDGGVTQAMLATAIQNLLTLAGSALQAVPASSGTVRGGVRTVWNATTGVLDIRTD